MPVRGHSKVQGDRTMGVWERMPREFLDALGREFGFTPPTRHGLDSVDGIRAMRDGTATVFLGVAGNFVRASPDSDVTEAAMRRCRLTAHISTKLNRSHTVCGDTALILPTLGRGDRDVQATGVQFYTAEDSMSEVHASRGKLPPASPHLLSEVAIIARLARRTLGADPAVPVNPADLDALGLADRALVDLVSVWHDGVERRAEGFVAVSYRTARGSAAAYYPETNVLVPLDSVAGISNTPTSKGVLVRLDPAGVRRSPADRPGSR